MHTINWKHEVEKRKDQIIKETQGLLQIKSVFDEETIKENAPFGKGILNALNFLLKRGKENHFKIKNLDGYAGYIEFGEGEESIGILCHLDVVPEGNDWSYPPYGAVINDGKIYARGAIDDKGPTMAAFYAMKIVKELNLPLKKRVRMILGCDEESSWKCVDHYFKHEEMPTIGFAPDADFPIIFAEKGIVDFRLTFGNKEKNEVNSSMELISFQSGRRLNMVPDHAVAKIHVLVEKDSIIDSFKEFLDQENLEGSYNVEGSLITLEVKGISAHGMEPNNGRNAGLLLIKFLSKMDLDPNAGMYVNWIYQNLGQDSRGRTLGIAFTDEITGPLTVNVGVFRYSNNEGVGHVDINVRYPVTQEFDQIIKGIKNNVCSKLEISILDHSKPHHVDKEHVLIKTLQDVYEKQTGEKAELLSIGGGTYARSLEAGVAFGPLFPNREDIAHQKDEHIFIEDLLSATAIYAEAIYELAK